MICKWCGATIDIAKGKCSVCGREIPALSDCGGFYDVVPKATRPAVPQTIQAPSRRAKEEAAKTDSATCQQRDDHAVLPIVTLVLLLVFGLFAVVQSISLSKRVAALENRGDTTRDSMEQQQQGSNSALVQSSEVTEGFTSEPAVQESAAQKPSELNELHFDVTLSQNGSSISTDLPNQGTLEYQALEEDQKSAAYYLDGKLLWKASLSEVPNENGLSKGKSFCFSYETDSEQLGQYQLAEFIWLYRSPNAAKWIELEESNNIQIKTDGALSTSTITIADSWFLDTFADGDCEIKCKIECRSKDGRTLIIDFGFLEIQG